MQKFNQLWLGTLLISVNFRLILQDKVQNWVTSMYL